MTRTIIILFAFLHLVSYANCKQYLYIETRLGGCNEPIPMAYYVEISDSINPRSLLENDSLIVEYLNRSEKIYIDEDMVYILRDTTITKEVGNKFIKDYEQYRKEYNFVRVESWDHFQIKIAIVEHDVIKYSNIQWANPKNVELYEYQNNAIHIIIDKKSKFNFAYLIE